MGCSHSRRLGLSLPEVPQRNWIKQASEVSYSEARDMGSLPTKGHWFFIPHWLRVCAGSGVRWAAPEAGSAVLP